MKRVIFGFLFFMLLVSNALAHGPVLSLHDDLIAEGTIFFLCHNGPNDTSIILAQNKESIPQYYLLHRKVYIQYGKFYARVHTCLPNMVGVVSIYSLWPDGIWGKMIIPLSKIVEMRLDAPLYD